MLMMPGAPSLYGRGYLARTRVGTPVTNRPYRAWEKLELPIYGEVYNYLDSVRRGYSKAYNYLYTLELARLGNLASEAGGPQSPVFTYFRALL